MKHLVLIHGRSQQLKDSTELKKDWVDGLKQGLANAGHSAELNDSKIHFPYYGDTLINLIDKVANPAPIVVKGLNASTPEQIFKAFVFSEAVEQAGVTNDEIQRELPAAEAEAAQVTKKGPLNWGWVLAGLRVIDKLKGGSWALETFTNDVYQYLTDDDIREQIDTGVREAITNEPTVVIAHSLGTVVAYELMKDDRAKSWNITTLITLGCPLAVSAVSDRIRPLIRPAPVDDWYNGRDSHDTVALFPLRPKRFPVELTGSKDDINNTSENHHGIESYLADTDVAHWIYKAIQD